MALQMTPFDAIVSTHDIFIMYATYFQPERFEEVVERIVFIREGLNQAAHFETLQRLFQTRISTHSPDVAVVWWVRHSTVGPHVLQPRKSGFPVLTNALANLAQ